MRYKIERYKNCERMNEQYPEIYRFLLRAEKLEYNAHFHWGRFAWMHTHTMLDRDKLTNIVMFRDEKNEIAGMATYDTFYDDRVYLIHTVCDKCLLNEMVDTVLQSEEGTVTIKVNEKDEALANVLRERQFVRKHKDVSVLELDLGGALEYEIPDGYSISPEDFAVDNWQYQLVIHKGFENEGIPEKWEDKLFAHESDSYIKTFAVSKDTYCAHCGLWYTEGATAYVEPVVTIPEHRRKGLARAVIYEACARAKNLGAQRATVLSDQAFYYQIGFTRASEVFCWEKNREANGVFVGK